MTAPLDLNGVEVRSGYLDADAQHALLAELRDVVRQAPFVQHITPGGRKMSVRMTAAGRFGWICDAGGYRYAPRHPSGVGWPPIPPGVRAVWDALAPGARAPECCLINLYGDGARMGLHQDRDEADLTQPVVSVSLGDDGLFRVGGTNRRDPTRSVWLRSGDIAILSGAGRMAFHGVDRIRYGSSTVLRQGGRLNLTLRVVG